MTAVVPGMPLNEEGYGSVVVITAVAGHDLLRHQCQIGINTPQFRMLLNPKVMMGKPVIRGSRITVEHVLRKLGAGMTRERFLEEYPGITDADVSDALAFAADYLSREGLMAAE